VSRKSVASHRGGVASNTRTIALGMSYVGIANSDGLFNKIFKPLLITLF